MRVRFLLLVSLLYFGLTVALTWPLVAAPASLVPADIGDPMLNAWILWWNAHSVPLTATWWNAPAFYPTRDVLAFSEHLLGLTWLTSPLQWAGVDPLAAYNVAFVASWMLGGVTAWALGYELTGRFDAALVGSAVFAFAPYRAAQLSHLQVLTAYWMPLALMALHRYVRTAAARWLGVFGCAWLAQGLSNGYFLVFFGVLAAGWALWFAAARDRWIKLAGIVCAACGVALASLPLLLKYRAVHEHFGLERSMEEISRFSADILAVLTASTHLAIWGWLRVFPRPEGELFPGLGVLLVIAGGLLLTPAAVVQSRWLRIARRVVAAAWLLAVAGCVSYGVAGRWKASWLGIGVSVRDPMRPLEAAVAFGAVLIATWPGLGGAIARRSALLFYVAAAGVLWCCTLGPRPAFAGVPLGWDSPYARLASVPGFAGLRVPARFWMVVVLCLSAAASLAYARWPVPVRWRPAAGWVLAALIVAEGWVRPFPMTTAPGPWPALVAHGSPTPVLQLPGEPRQPDTVAMYRAGVARRPIVNGYSGYFPPAHAILVQALGMYDLSVLNGLSARGPLDILLDRSQDDLGRYRRKLQDSRAASIAHDDRWTLFRLPPLEVPPVAGPRREVRPVAIRASDNDDLAPRAVDGRIDTAWHTDGQRPGQTLTLDLGVAVRAGAVRLRQAALPLDYPLHLRVERSVDGVTWARGWEGPTAAFAWQAAVDRPREIPVTIPLDGCLARYLRLRIGAESFRQGWTVAEVSVLEAAAGGCRETGS